MSEPIAAITPLNVQAERIDYRRTDRLQQSGAGNEKGAREIKLRKAVQDFESLFMYKLLKSMRSTVPQSDGPGFGMETMRDITDEQLAVYLARQGGIGLGEMLYQSLKQREEQAADGDRAARPEEPGPAEPAPVPHIRGETARPVQQITETRPRPSGHAAPKIHTGADQ